MTPEEATALLNAEIQRIMRQRSVRDAAGPPLAYFETVGEPPVRYIYQVYSMGGLKPEGHRRPTSQNVHTVIGSTVREFESALKPKMLLLWRASPEMECEGTLWTSYMRWVQVEEPDEGRLALYWDT